VHVCTHISGNIRPNFSAHFAGGRGLFLHWWHHDTLCSFGFVDNVMFSNNGPSGSVCYHSSIVAMLLAK